MSFSLYPSQEDYLKRLGNKPYIFAGVGSGKTLMALFRAYRTGSRKVLVICPASVRDTKVWELDLEKSELEFDDFQVKGYSFLQKFKDIDFSEYKDYYIIIDEAHKIKNSQSKQGLGAFYLCRLTERGYSLLSGTPMSKWADAVNYAKITGLVKNKTEFYNRYVIETRVKGYPEIVDYVHKEELVKWWNSIALRGRSEEFVELPEKQVIRVDIPIKRKEYVSMLKTYMTEDGEVLDSPSKLTWALRQFAEVAPEKINWTVEKIEGLDNCLVFVNTVNAIEKLSEALKKKGIKHGVWYGAKKDKFADQNVMIVQYQSGGTGLNLQKFNTTIFLSPCYSFIDYSQAEGRTYRNGQSKRCVFYQLKSQHTIDAAIYKALNAKKDFDNNLTNLDDKTIIELLNGTA